MKSPKNYTEENEYLENEDKSVLTMAEYEKLMRKRFKGEEVG